MTFEDWYLNKQGGYYDSMYLFARDAWQAAQEAERERCRIAACQACSAEDICEVSMAILKLGDE